MTFDSVDAVTAKLAQQINIADNGLSTGLWLAFEISKALFIEGEAGISKAEVANSCLRHMDVQVARGRKTDFARARAGGATGEVDERG